MCLPVFKTQSRGVDSQFQGILQLTVPRNGKNKRLKR